MCFEKTIKECKRKGMFVLVILILALFCLEVGAANFLFIDSTFDTAFDDYIVNDIYFVSSENIFYYWDIEGALHHEPVYSETDRIVFYDEQRNILFEHSIQFQDVSAIPFDADISRIGSFTIFRGSAAYVAQQTDFCNNNGICEPCTVQPCSHAETSLYCNDCHSGSLDSYCDIKRDGICDPDCRNYDGDCVLCGSTCLFDDMRGLDCAEIGGSVCGYNEDCLDGSFVRLNYDMEFCCVRGRCLNLNEHIETIVEMQDQPSMTITPSGELASTIISEGSPEDYCASRLGESICGEYERCEGEDVEYYYDTYCCIGECVKLPYADEIAVRQAEDVDFESDMPMSEEEIEFMASMDWETLPEEEVFDYTRLEPMPEEVDPIDAREAAHQEIADDIDERQRKEQLKETLSKFIPSVPEKIKGFNFTILIGSLLVLVLLVFVFVVIFRHSAGKKLAGSEQKVRQEMAQPSISLQSSINSLVSKGYSYTQIRSYLMDQGYQQNIVDGEIRKNYGLRKSAQSMRK